MRKMSVEMQSNPQQNHLGMESNALVSPDGATMTGNVRTISEPVIGSSVFPKPIAGAGTVGARIRSLSCPAPSCCWPCVISGLRGSALRSVSFFGSAITNHVAPGKVTENRFFVTPTFRPSFPNSVWHVFSANGASSFQPGASPQRYIQVVSKR
jgi:hypothetical protein